MTEVDLLDRLAAHRLVGSAPRAELEWLAAHGQRHRYAPGELILRRGVRSTDFHIVLSGRFAIHVEDRHGWRRVLEWGPGDVAGLLPYSRMTGSPGDTVVEEEVESLAVHESLFPELVRECPHVTATAVHVMVDRARHFNSASLQDEKMLSLGKVAAGLAHEINNPASAAARSAQLLGADLRDADEAALAVGALGLEPAQRALLMRVREACLASPATTPRSTIEHADRQDEVSDWLARHGADDGPALGLADTPVTVEMLDELAEALAGPALDAALRWVAVSCGTQALAREIERATSRIHQLVSSIRRFSYMDRALVAEPVDVGQLLADTVAVLASRARTKSVSVELQLDPGLPRVSGFGGELNQVWMNLIDNAVDAAPVGGHVIVSAKLEGAFVAVRVTDDGPGIPDHIRPKIFDPFFTTKPPGQGTGLGLDIVQRIVRGHRAELDVSSRPGRTEFRVGLPLDSDGGGGPTSSA